jgi:hypothetical protein
MRAPEAEWERWQRVAEKRGYTVSSWLRTLATMEADRLEAEERRDQAAREERARLLSVKNGQSF